MNRTIKIGLFALLIVAQLAVPASMIAGRESVLRNGTAHKFRTMPVDPYDPFRGRYVALRYEASTVQSEDPYTRGQKVWVAVETDEDGYAALGEISTSRPDNGDYLRLPVAYAYDAVVSFDLPFDRYYMNEYSAPEAERVVQRRAWEEDIEDIYVVVKIHRGRAVLESLYVEDQTIEDFLLTSPPQ